uniref:8 kDa glycoprotein n=5 Tax=Taeniidae TaxID=6208 RepID=B6E498_ECHGR|nr:8 kDa glycoprotein [Echinococcus granulosus]ACI32102.1 8 kDa glycoprotein [Echinococcus granulosus]ACI32111.1 8 kDa glycoprotein [Taenia hydatigena]ADB93872.1 8 kDa glycoprotein [Taenia pisiformis]AEP03206.1 Ts18 variant 4 [Taenia solium]
MRAYIVLLALTVFVVAVSAGENKQNGDANSTKKEIEILQNWLFHVEPIGKQIVRLAKDWNAAVLEAKGKFRKSLAEYCRGLKNITF